MNNVPLGIRTAWYERGNKKNKKGTTWYPYHTCPFLPRLGSSSSLFTFPARERTACATYSRIPKNMRLPFSKKKEYAPPDFVGI